MNLGFKSIVVSMLIMGLFIVALVNFGDRLAIVNNAQDNIRDSPIISKILTNTTSSLITAQSDAESANTAFSNSPITLTSTPFVNAIGSIWKTMKIVPIAIWNAIFEGTSSALGLSGPFAVVFTILAGIFIIGIVLAAWQTIATGKS